MRRNLINEILRKRRYYAPSRQRLRISGIVAICLVLLAGAGVVFAGITGARFAMRTVSGHFTHEKQDSLKASFGAALGIELDVCMRAWKERLDVTHWLKTPVQENVHALRVACLNHPAALPCKSNECGEQKVPQIEKGGVET